jgi:hypothetical protein
MSIKAIAFLQIMIGVSWRQSDSLYSDERVVKKKRSDPAVAASTQTCQ